MDKNFESQLSITVSAPFFDHMTLQFTLRYRNKVIQLQLEEGTKCSEL